MDSRIIEWDGSHVPEELRQLPPGRYVVEPVTPPLTPQEEKGILEAIAALDAGKGVSFDDAMNELEGDAPDP